MSSRTTSKTSATSATSATEIQPTADDFRAYADQMAANPGLSFNDWFSSPAGEAQRVAFADQQKAALRKDRMSQARAVWRDLKVNGQVTTYSVAKLRELLAYLTSLDLDNLPEPTAKVTEDAATEDATEDAAS